MVPWPPGRDEEVSMGGYLPRNFRKGTSMTVINFCSLSGSQTSLDSQTFPISYPRNMGNAPQVIDVGYLVPITTQLLSRVAQMRYTHVISCLYTPGICHGAWHGHFVSLRPKTPDFTSVRAWVTSLPMPHPKHS